MTLPEESHRLGKLAEELTATLRRVPREDPVRARKRPTRELGELIEALCLKYGLGRNTPEEALREGWPGIVGTPNAAFSHPARIDPGGKLVVLVSHAVVRNELFMARETVLERVRAVPGCEGINRVFFTTG